MKTKLRITEVGSELIAGTSKKSALFLVAGELALTAFQISPTPTDQDAINAQPTSN